MRSGMLHYRTDKVSFEAFLNLTGELFEGSRPDLSNAVNVEQFVMAFFMYWHIVPVGEGATN